MIIPWIHFLKEDEQLLVETFTTRRVINGPGQYTARPFERVTKRSGLMLEPTDYVRLRDTLTGELRNEIGPQLYFLTASEEVDEHLDAIPLKENQYVRLLDKSTGMIRVARGETTVYLQPTEELMESVTDGVNIDEEIAVLTRDVSSGQLRLITEPGVFIPAPNQEIVRTQKRVRLEDHEVVIIKDREGRYIFRRGSDIDRSFFIEPHTELVTLWWSAGLHKNERSLALKQIDLRPKFMWYEFEVRTQDNVELVLGVTFFWRILDVEQMVGTTDDTTGDMCSHARSTIIQAVSRVTLEQFLADFNEIIRAATLGDADDPFYADRGVAINAVEVRSITCKDPDTQRILNEIIQETTNRLNRLQKQESENEVTMRRLQGEIEVENARGDLLATRRDHARTEALTLGEAEADKVRAFLDQLPDGLSQDDKVALFNTLRKQDMLDVLSKGQAHLYFTPADVNLSIETT
jgi:hypothetical protein